MTKGYVTTEVDFLRRMSLDVYTIGFQEFFPSADSVKEVRLFVKKTLERVGLDDDNVFECELVADELAANAVQHAGSTFSVAVELTEEVVRIAVRDESIRPPVPQPSGAQNERGRGLDIVSGTSNGWGSVRLGRGKEIWADVSRAAL